MKFIPKLLLAAATATMIISCDNDDDTITSVNAPSNYSFERNGQTSVSYSGQTDRILMAEEVLDGLKDPSTSLNTLQAQFDHTQGQNNFSDPALNSSTKSVRSKVAASSDYFSSNSVGTSLKGKSYSSTFFIARCSNLRGDD